MVFHRHGSEVHGSLKNTSELNKIHRAGSTFSLFRNGVCFTFQSPLLFPTHSPFPHAKLWRKRSNTGNQKPAALRIFATGWTELRDEAGHSSLAHTLSNVNTHVQGRLMQSNLQLIYHENFLPLVQCALCMFAGGSSTSTRSCIFIFLDAHSATS